MLDILRYIKVRFRVSHLIFHSFFFLLNANQIVLNINLTFVHHFHEFLYFYYVFSLHKHSRCVKCIFVLLYDTSVNYVNAILKLKVYVQKKWRGENTAHDVHYKSKSNELHILCLNFKTNRWVP